MPHPTMPGYILTPYGYVPASTWAAYRAASNR